MSADLARAKADAEAASKRELASLTAKLQADVAHAKLDAAAGGGGSGVESGDARKRSSGARADVQAAALEAEHAEAMERLRSEYEADEAAAAEHYAAKCVTTPPPPSPPRSPRTHTHTHTHTRHIRMHSLRPTYSL
jgi:hypothetical protein